MCMGKSEINSCYSGTAEPINIQSLEFNYRLFPLQLLLFARWRMWTAHCIWIEPPILIKQQYIQFTDSTLLIGILHRVPLEEHYSEAWRSIDGNKYGKIQTNLAIRQLRNTPFWRSAQNRKWVGSRNHMRCVLTFRQANALARSKKAATRTSYNTPIFAASVSRRYCAWPSSLWSQHSPLRRVL